VGEPRVPPRLLALEQLDAVLELGDAEREIVVLLTANEPEAG
jgi:hypothetical protein